MLKSRKSTPDELPARLQQEERTSRQPGWGRLKIFLGYAPGVGKTYMMLAEAHRRKERDAQDVVIGLVETYGRHATEELVKGLEAIACASVFRVSHPRVCRRFRQTRRAARIVGSGVTAENIHDYLEIADGVIVGTSLKQDGIVTNPVDTGRVRRLVEGAWG